MGGKREDIEHGYMRLDGKGWMCTERNVGFRPRRMDGYVEQ